MLLLGTEATTGQQQKAQEKSSLVERYDSAVKFLGTAKSKIDTTCKSARKAVVYYRNQTYAFQDRRGSAHATKTPIVRGKTCYWSTYAADVWVARSASAKRAYKRWWKERGEVIALLERGVKGTPMEGTGVALEKYGRMYGVSPFFIVAVAATESSIGHAACGPGGYNAWGLGNCGSAWSVPTFSSWTEAIAYYARFLTSRWPEHSSPYSFQGYAACDDCWSRKVSSWMQSLFGVSTRTAYP